jgi:hypothetical protein
MTSIFDRFNNNLLQNCKKQALIFGLASKNKNLLLNLIKAFVNSITNELMLNLNFVFSLIN